MGIIRSISFEISVNSMHFNLNTTVISKFSHFKRELESLKY